MVGIGELHEFLNSLGLDVTSTMRAIVGAGRVEPFQLVETDQDADDPRNKRRETQRVRQRMTRSMILAAGFDEWVGRRATG